MTPQEPPDILLRAARFFSSRQVTAYLVGGYLRDAFLSLSGKDLDIAISADPQLLGQELARALGGTHVPLSVAHGVARVVVPRRSAPPADPSEQTPWTIDLTHIAGGIEEDLSRRDFTIDAMAYPLADWPPSDGASQLVDPFNGRQDLVNKNIRTVSPSVFQDDPGRLMRGVRLAARLGFRLDMETARLIRTAAPLVSGVSGERVRDEFLATLAEDGAMGQLEALDRLDLLCRVIPELAITKGVAQPREHYWDVWGHSLHCVEFAERVTGGHQNSAVYTQVPWTPETEEHFQQVVSDGHRRRTILKLAALFHDIAKPQTKKQDETGRTRFLGHAEMGAEMASRRLRQLRISSRGVGMVAKMVEQHLRPNHMRQGVESPTPRAIYRYFRDLEGVAIDTLYLSLADYLAAKGPELNPDDWADHARMVAHVLQAGSEPPGTARASRLLNGHDLMAHFKLSPGPQVGVLLAKIEEAQAAGEITTREQALALAQEELGGRNPGR